VDAAQTRLRVHFIKDTPNAAALQLAITEATITGGETIPTVAVNDGWHWDTDANNRPFVELSVDVPGAVSTYTFAFTPKQPVLDRVYDHVAFTFKAGCPSTIDCARPAVAAEPSLEAAPPIDYLAKDFEGFRRALSDFSALRYPAWQ